MNARARWVAGLRRASMEGVAALAVLLLVLVSIIAWHGHSLAVDAISNYRDGARDLFAGRSPYELGDIPRGTIFTQPPIAGILYAPLLLVPARTAEVIAAVFTLASVAGALWVLDVRDWRCYAIVGLWFPTLFAFQSGNLSALLTLLVAITWRYRDRWPIAVAAIAFAVALKLYCWPLIVFLFITRRVRAGIAAVASSVALIFVPWAAFGFIGLSGYEHLLTTVAHVEQPESFGLADVFASVMSWPLARIAAYAIGVALLAVAWLLSGDRERFLLCLAATLALTPILWMHYFVMLLIVAALAQPRLHWIWFAPLALWIAPRVPQTPHGRPGNVVPAWQVATVAAIVAAVFAASIFDREVSAGSRAR